MIEPFADPVWADFHEKLSASVVAGLERLAPCLRRGGKVKDESPAVKSGRGGNRPPQPRSPAS
jgi:hypothetical protein